MTLQCEHCGGSVEVRPLALLVKCPYCGMALVYEKEPFIGRFLMKRLIAYPMAARIFDGRLEDAGLREPAEKGEPELFYFPFWRITTKLKDDEQVRFTPGANPEAALFSRMRLPEGELMEFHPGAGYDAPIREATVSADAALDRLSSQGDGFDVVKELALLYAPFYLMRVVSGGGHRHLLLLEGSSGKLYDDLPSRRSPLMLFQGGLPYLLAFLAFVIEGGLIRSVVGKLVAFCLTMVPAYLALSYFREREEE